MSGPGLILSSGGAYLALGECPQIRPRADLWIWRIVTSMLGGQQGDKGAFFGLSIDHKGLWLDCRNLLRRELV